MSGLGRRPRPPIVLVALAMLGAGLGFGSWRVIRLERHELTRHTAWRSIRDAPAAAEGTDGRHRRRLAEVTLYAGQHVEVELCGRDALRTATGHGHASVEIWLAEPRRRVLSTPLDRRLFAHARRTTRGSCVVAARAQELPRSGRFSLELSWEPETLGSAELGPLRTRVAAWRPLSSTDRATVLVTLLGALLMWAALVFPPPYDPFAAELGEQPPEQPASRPRGPPSPLRRLTFGVAVIGGLGAALSFVPWGGSTYGLTQGLLLAGAQVAVAVTVLPAAVSRLRALSLRGPVRPWWILLIAPVAGVGVRLVAGVLMRFIPSTTEAPIQAFVSMPSGTLAVALVAVAVPLAEETFFRGFVYGLVEQRAGSWVAVIATTLLFAVAHLPQLWGSWGSMASIFVTGLVLTLLRRWFGSALVPALAHITHNAMIVVGTLL